MTILCDAIHPEFRINCGLEKGHLSDHVGMVGKISVVWPNNDHDEENIARAITWAIIGVFIAGAVVAFACAVIGAAG